MTLPARSSWLRGLLLVAALPAVVWGAAAMVSAELVAGLTSALSLASVRPTPEINYLLKPLGLYLVMFGFALLYAATDPVRNRAIVTWGAWILLLCGAQRLWLTWELHRLFAIPVALNLIHVAYLVAMGSALLLLRPSCRVPPRRVRDGGFAPLPRACYKQ